MPPDAPTAFFSYSRKDSEFALRLAEDLKAEGADVWLDQLDIAPGQRWARAVQDALQNSPRVLVILSPASVNSNHVEDEVNFALDEQKTVIPVFYQDCKVPFRLRPLQYVDFRTNYAHGLKIMLKTLGVKQQSTASPAAPEKARLEQQERERQAAAEKARLEQEERELLRFRPKALRRGTASPHAETLPAAFKFDVYISYTHSDGEWVRPFVESLTAVLHIRLGRHSRIWFDQGSFSGDQFDQAMAAKLQSSVALLAVVSPGYVHSDHCRRELETFLEGAHETGGVMLGRFSRVLPVFRIPVPREDLPRTLADVLGYQFYNLNLGPALEKAKRQEFIEGIVLLADDICELLRTREKELPPSV